MYQMSPDKREKERLDSGWTNWSVSPTVKTPVSRRGGGGVQRNPPAQQDTTRLLRSRSYSGATPQPQRWGSESHSHLLIYTLYIIFKKWSDSGKILCHGCQWTLIVIVLEWGKIVKDLCTDEWQRRECMVGLKPLRLVNSRLAEFFSHREQCTISGWSLFPHPLKTEALCIFFLNCISSL